MKKKTNELNALRPRLARLALPTLVLIAAAFAVFSTLSEESAHAQVWTCPTGMRMYGTPGAESSFCIEIAYHSGYYWGRHMLHCSSTGYTLCSLREWQTACNDLGPKDLNIAAPDSLAGPQPESYFEPTVTEAAGLRFSGNTDSLMSVGGNGSGCSGTTNTTFSGTPHYRCCLR